MGPGMIGDRKRPDNSIHNTEKQLLAARAGKPIGSEDRLRSQAGDRLPKGSDKRGRFIRKRPPKGAVERKPESANNKE